MRNVTMSAITFQSRSTWIPRAAQDVPKMAVGVAVAVAVVLGDLQVLAGLAECLSLQMGRPEGLEELKTGAVS